MVRGPPGRLRRARRGPHRVRRRPPGRLPTARQAPPSRWPRRRRGRRGLPALREAYEALRDPHSRVRYDAEGLAGERRRTTEPPEPAADARLGPSARPDLGWAELSLRRLGPRHCRSPSRSRALALLAAVGSLGVGWSRVPSRDRSLAELRRRRDDARHGDFRTWPRHRWLLMPQVYHGSFVPARLRRARSADPCPPGCGGRRQRSRSAACRPVAPGSFGRECLDRAADRGGLLVDAWELALLRRVTAQYLVGHGIPASGWRSGSRPAPGTPAAGGGPQAVALELVCCADGRPG